jgi:hypothetical protein
MYIVLISILSLFMHSYGNRRLSLFGRDLQLSLGESLLLDDATLATA